ncbi:33285_t:CDS:2 [Gigaspora margarita]|uniref:33285_t:CDS:1 n=1 Tax=Gigaspora margarita TaxID=4874 RepID=A0ABN7UIQ6_GIGMA|nr:33285_t:CDS:2 [Gigaspora margarita]
MSTVIWIKLTLNELKDLCLFCDLDLQGNMDELGERLNAHFNKRKGKLPVFGTSNTIISEKLLELVGNQNVVGTVSELFLKEGARATGSESEEKKSSFSSKLKISKSKFYPFRDRSSYKHYKSPSQSHVMTVGELVISLQIAPQLVQEHQHQSQGPTRMIDNTWTKIQIEKNILESQMEQSVDG